MILTYTVDGIFEWKINHCNFFVLIMGKKFWRFLFYLVLAVPCHPFVLACKINKQHAQVHPKLPIMFKIKIKLLNTIREHIHRPIGEVCDAPWVSGGQTPLLKEVKITIDYPFCLFINF